MYANSGYTPRLSGAIEQGRKCGGFPMVINGCEIIFNKSVKLGIEIVVLPNSTVRHRWNKRTVFVTYRLFSLLQ